MKRLLWSAGGFLLGALLAVGVNSIAGPNPIMVQPGGDLASGGIVEDDNQRCFGTDSDFCLLYDETTNDDFEIVNSDCDGSDTDCVIAWGNKGDAHFYVGTQTQGIQLRANETNGYLSIYDESGGDAIIKSSSFNVSKYGIQFYRGPTANVSNGYPTGNIDNYTADATGTSASGWLGYHTGDQSNAGNYASGAITIYSGDTTTDGNSGGIDIYSGVAGAGIADAGDIRLAVNGAPGTGTTVFSVDASASSIDQAKLRYADLDATCTAGQIAVDNGGGTTELCVCQATDTWYCIAVGDTTGPAD